MEIVFLHRLDTSVQEWDVLLAADFDAPQTNAASSDWQSEKLRRSLKFVTGIAAVKTFSCFCYRLRILGSMSRQECSRKNNQVPLASWIR